MSVAVRKIPGVEAVDVSLTRAVAEIRLAAGNTVTLAQLRQLVKNSGFNSPEAAVTVAGQLSSRGSSSVLTITGTNVVLLLTADASHPAAFEQVRARAAAPPSGPVTLEGTVRASSDAKQPDQMSVRQFSGPAR